VLCCAVLRCDMALHPRLCCAVALQPRLCCALICCDVLLHTVLRYAMQRYAVLCHAVVPEPVQCHVMILKQPVWLPLARNLTASMLLQSIWPSPDTLHPLSVKPWAFQAFVLLR